LNKKQKMVAAIMMVCAILALIFGGVMGGSSASAGGYSGVSTVALRQVEELSAQARLAGKICNAKSDSRRALMVNRFERRKFELDLELDRLGYPFETPTFRELTDSLMVEGKCPPPAGALG
jgi:hypothetical protein